MKFFEVRPNKDNKHFDVVVAETKRDAAKAWMDHKIEQFSQAFPSGRDEKWIIVDQFLGGEWIEEAPSAMEAAIKVHQRNTNHLMEEQIKEPLHLREHDQIPGAFIVNDDVTHEGWGKGCKYDGRGKEMKHQVILAVIPT